MIKEYLNQPYPVMAHKWRLIIPISLFIAVFMLIFQPFGLTNFHDSLKSIIFSGYGLVTFLVLSINLFILPYIFKKWFDFNKWTVIKQILWLTWIIFTIGIGNYLYSSIIFSVTGGFKGFLIFQLLTLAVGIIPIVVVTVVNQNMQLSHYLKEAHDLNIKIEAKNDSGDNDRVICLIAENEKNKLEIDMSDFLFIESIGNYVQVHYFKDSKICKAMLRSSLKRIEAQLKEHTSLVRCHRAFLVNVNKIVQAKGNSQGLSLALVNSDHRIPVSRNYTKDLKDKISLR